MKKEKKRRKQSYLLNETQRKTRSREGRTKERNGKINERKEERKKGVEIEVTWKRQDPRKGSEREETKRKELAVEAKVKQRSGVERTEGVYEERRKKVDKGRKRRRREVVEKRRKGEEKGKKGEETGPKEWKESVVLVGTGYRVRKDEKDPRTRRFDVGYCDRKTYKRKEGVEAVVEGSNMGRRVSGKGEGARVKVMNAVAAMEKRRPASEYTGSGIRRKSRVGNQKLKPTKPQAKQ